MVTAYNEEWSAQKLLYIRTLCLSACFPSASYEPEDTIGYGPYGHVVDDRCILLYDVPMVT